MQDIILVGSGGCMRELLWQIEEMNQTTPTWNVLGYVDASQPESPIMVGKKKYGYLGTDEYLLCRNQETNVAITVGSPGLRKKIAQNLKSNPYLRFPNLILTSTCICRDVKMGHGNIISMDCRISTNVSLGNFVFLNMGATICHDGQIKDYVTLSPRATLAGNVTVGQESDLGMGTNVIQGTTIGSKVVTGAGSVVIRDLFDNCTAVGVPAAIRK